MALEGTIRDFGLPDIFQLIGLQRKTGILTLQSEKDEITVTFENGMVVMADSSTKRLEDRLGTVLVKQGKISKERLEEALQIQKATLQRLGHIFMSSNAITAKDLKDALMMQVSQIVFKVFRWRDGEYHFAPTDNVDYDRDNFTPMSADFILMEGIRMVDEWPIIEKKIPSMDLVFRPVVDASLIEVMPEGDESNRHAPTSNKIRLTAFEEQVFRRVDGTRTVQAVIDSSGHSEFEVCRSLFDLLNRNLITTVGRGVAKASPAGRTEGKTRAVPTYVVAAAAGLVALVGIWMQRTTPFGVTGLKPYLRGSHQLLLEGVSHARLDRLDQAVAAFQLAQGTLPRTLEDVVTAGLVDRRYLKDPWARPFHYALTVDGYLLCAVDDSGRQNPSTVIERALPPERP
jgi:hypothetical protein